MKRRISEMSRPLVNYGELFDEEMQLLRDQSALISAKDFKLKNEKLSFWESMREMVIRFLFSVVLGGKSFTLCLLSPATGGGDPAGNKRPPNLT